MAEFEYTVEADYNDDGDEVRPELTLTINYNRHTAFYSPGSASYEITDVFKPDGEGRYVRVEESELKSLLGERAWDILEEAAYEDWFEYGSDR